MTQYSYQLNCGQYVLHQDGKPYGPLLDEVAICLDVAAGIRHKHGSPESVRAWHANAQQKFRSVGANKLADDLVVIQGRFPLDVLQDVIENSSAASKLYAQIIAGSAPSLDIHGKLIQPVL